LRGRVVLLVILAVAIALVAVYVTGWSPSTPTTAAESPTATPSGTPEAPAQQDASQPAQSSGSAKAAPKVSTPAATTPKAASKPGGNAAQQPAAKPAPKPAPKPQPSTVPVRFGPIGEAGWGSETDVSEDGRALTTAFSDLQVGLGNEDAPDVSRSMRMTIPLTAGAEGETLAIHAQGFAFTDEHAKAQLVLRARGRTIVQQFPAGSEEEFVRTLELPAVPGVTYELSAVLEVEPVGDSLGAYLNIISIDAEIR
jgi:hypothetical protein